MLSNFEIFMHINILALLNLNLLVDFIQGQQSSRLEIKKKKQSLLRNFKHHNLLAFVVNWVQLLSSYVLQINQY